MLHRLTIRNFAIIERLEIEWGPRLNVITGETGAGKSIIIDAVGALLGDRLAADVVRGGADRALVEGVFAVPESDDLATVLEEYGLEVEDGALIVTRDIAAAGGRGGARVNGRGVPLSVLQEIGEHLVDVHGQSQHMALLRPREQLAYLDRYAGVLDERTALATLVRELRDVREARSTLIAEEREMARLQDVLRHEVDEIERADPRQGEEEEIQAQRTRLEHSERLRQVATTAYQMLSGFDEGETERAGAIDMLGRAVASVQEGERFDAALATEVEQLSAALAAAEDSARSLRTYLDSIEADPAALERLTERVFVLGDLKRKYGTSIGDVLEYAATARARLEGIHGREERLADLTHREVELADRIRIAAGELSSRRRAAAERLTKAVERELEDLRLTGTRFHVSITPLEECDMTGADRVELLISANPGEEPRPMARVASGGELARLALAMKTILARAETRSTLIFDEIDMGVGGRTAPVVGEKLWSVAAAGHQVLCVTHMPQVAAYADTHYVVAKQADGAQAETRVTELDADARLEELASMLAGTPSRSSRDSAQELLERARLFREAVSS